jgi:hypothetical protein
MKRSMFLTNRYDDSEKIDWKFKIASLSTAVKGIEQSLINEESYSSEKKRIVKGMFKRLEAMEKIHEVSMVLSPEDDKKVEEHINKIILGMTIIKNDVSGDFLAKTLWPDSVSGSEITDDDIASVDDLTINFRRGNMQSSQQ